MIKTEDRNMAPSVKASSTHMRHSRGSECELDHDLHMQQPATKRARFADSVNSTQQRGSPMLLEHAMYAAMQEQQAQHQQLMYAVNKMASNMTQRQNYVPQMMDADTASTLWAAMQMDAPMIAAAMQNEGPMLASDQSWMGLGTSSSMDFLGDEYDARQMSQSNGQQWRTATGQSQSQRDMPDSWWEYLSA